METLALNRVDPDLASALLSRCRRFIDPRGAQTQADIPAMARRGQCFTAVQGDSQAVYVFHVSGAVAWIDAAMGAGPADWSGLLLPAIEGQAKGCARVEFQTARRGLRRRAERQGYSVRETLPGGWVMGKDLR